MSDDKKAPEENVAFVIQLTELDYSKDFDEDDLSIPHKLVAYPNEFDVSLAPSGALIVTEMVADVGNKNEGNPIPSIRRIFAPHAWNDVVMVK